MKVAYDTAELSYAKRKKVGVVAVKNNAIIAAAYNGTPPDFENECEDIVDEKLVTKPEVIHAEMNLIAQLAKSSASSDGCSVFSTYSACMDCAKLMIASGVKEFYYDEIYRDISPLEFLIKNGVKVQQWIG